MSLDAIGIVSKNLTRSKEFYGLLGLTVSECGGPDHLEATLANGMRLMLDSVELVKKINPDYKEPQGSGIMLCFLQDSPTSVNDLYTKITNAGFASVKEPWDAFWGQRYASVSDPDGNQIDIFASL